MEAEFSLRSDLKDIGGVREWLGAHAQASGFSAKDVSALCLAVTEACVNIVEHAYCGQTDGDIDLHLSIDDRQLALSLMDYGKQFDVGSYQAPDLMQPHEDGYGVLLIQSLMDEVHYVASLDGTMTLTLIKRRASATE